MNSLPYYLASDIDSSVLTEFYLKINKMLSTHLLDEVVVEPFGTEDSNILIVTFKMGNNNLHKALQEINTLFDIKDISGHFSKDFVSLKR